MFIELHLLQNFVPSNLNRDESNNPKDCVFGGARRARISSQCLKRAIRLNPAFEAMTGVSPAERTRYLATALAKQIEQAGKPADEAAQSASNLVGEILGGMDGKDKAQSKVLFFVSAEEKETLANVALNNWDNALAGNFKDKALADAVKNYKETFKNRTSAPGIAMFGRMLAEDPKLSLDAACQVAHAISTHRANMEFDFFTAVDDLQDEDISGAAMMGIIGFNSATFYRYARIDFKQLLKNLGGDLELAKKTVAAFLKASVLAVPTGKQTSFAAQNPPSILLAVVRKDGMSWSLANAFEQPVYATTEQGLLETSAEKLDAYWGELVNFYGGEVVPVAAVIGISPNLPNLCAHEQSSLESWLGAVMAALPKE